MRHEHPSSSCGLCCTRVEDLSVTLEGQSVLHGIDLHIHCGELTALIGPNGAGKTTFLRSLLGLVPYSGRVLFESAQGGAARPPRIGYVPQQMDLDKLAPLTVLDLFASATQKIPSFLAATRKAREAAREALSRIDAQELVERRLGALSGGELQRVLLALALTPPPDVLLLDEPVSGVDALGLERFYDAVKQVRSGYDLTCILVSHDLGAVRRHADRVVLLRGTVLDSGTPGEVFAGKAFREVFGFGEDA